MPIDPQLPSSFLARGDDGGIYYVAQRERPDEIWWFAEHPDARWAHVFRGRLTLDGTSARWDGTFIDVPKGVACGVGELGWERRMVAPRTPVLVRTSREGPRNRFGGTQIAPATALTTPSVRRLAPGFAGEGMENLTGVWIGDDGGTYYIREVAGTGQIAWVGEHPEARPRDPVTGSRWVNVFMGQRSDRLIRGHFSDVPKGEIDNHAPLTLFVASDRRIVMVSSSGGFGGTRFTRVENLSVTLRWVALTVMDQQEWILEGDEPYFYAMIARMDGATVDLTDPTRARVVTSDSLIAPMLRSNIGAGTVVSLSSLPPIDFPIVPVRGDTPGSAHPVLGIALRGVEKDFSTDGWRRDRLEDWVGPVRSELEHKLRTSRPITFATDVSRQIVSWGDTLPHDDDIFGLASTSFTRTQLLGLAGRTTRLTFNLRGGDVRYVVTADLEVQGVRGTCAP